MLQLLLDSNVKSSVPGVATNRSSNFSQQEGLPGFRPNAFRPNPCRPFFQRPSWKSNPNLVSFLRGFRLVDTWKVNSLIVLCIPSKTLPQPLSLTLFYTLSLTLFLILSLSLSLPLSSPPFPFFLSPWKDSTPPPGVRNFCLSFCFPNAFVQSCSSCCCCYVAVVALATVVVTVFVVVVQQQQHSIRRLQSMDNCYILPTLLGYCDTCRQSWCSRPAWNSWPTDT